MNDITYPAGRNSSRRRCVAISASFVSDMGTLLLLEPAPMVGTRLLESLYPPTAPLSEPSALAPSHSSCKVGSVELRDRNFDDASEMVDEVAVVVFVVSIELVGAWHRSMAL